MRDLGIRPRFHLHAPLGQPDLIGVGTMTSLLDHVRPDVVHGWGDGWDVLRGRVNHSTPWCGVDLAAGSIEAWNDAGAMGGCRTAILRANPPAALTREAARERLGVGPDERVMVLLGEDAEDADAHLFGTVSGILHVSGYRHTCVTSTTAAGYRRLTRHAHEGGYVSRLVRPRGLVAPLYAAADVAIALPVTQTCSYALALHVRAAAACGVQVVIPRQVAASAQMEPLMAAGCLTVCEGEGAAACARVVASVLDRARRASGLPDSPVSSFAAFWEAACAREVAS